MTLQRLRVLLAAVSLAVATTVGPFATIETVLAACVKQEAFSDHVPQAQANGGSMVWTLRTLSATDWNSGGFASEVLWVGTDNGSASDDWVEVGATHGWQGTNVYTYYAAQGRNGGASYSEFKFSIAPVVGQNDTFRVYLSPLHTDEYRAEITYPSGTFYTRFTNHHAPTVDISGGLEATCGTSRVDRTNVTSVKYRAASNGTYSNVNNGSLFDASSVGGIAWCTQPTKFRYWLNSSLATNVC